MRNVLRWFTILVLVLVVQTASAGGWATVSVDELPNDVQAGETLTIGFMIRQHGIRPAEDLTPYLQATHVESGDSLRISAVEKGVVGHYEVTLAFPKAGTWNWHIVPDPFPILDDQAVVSLTVLPAPVVESASAPAANSSPTAAPATRWFVAGGILTVALVATVVVVRRTQRKPINQAQ